MLRRARIVAVALAFAAGLGAGCLIELDRGLSCGDGWVDRESGEACDPKDPVAAHRTACPEPAEGRCDPETCQISCPPRCGDGVVNGQEECDYAAACDSELDCPEEHICFEHECLRLGADQFLPERACLSFENTATKISKTKKYASGEVGRCTTSCVFDRSRCNFCGDGVLDPSYEDLIWGSGVPVTRPAEVCDWPAVDGEALALACEPLCADTIGPGGLTADMKLRCKPYMCTAGCQGVQVIGDIVLGEVECCLGSGSACPDPELNPELGCCGQEDDPNFVCEGTCP